MNCIECHEPMAVPERPADPFLCPDCRSAAAQGARYVEVTKPIGHATFPRCTADMFEIGVLAVSSVDDDALIEELPAGAWLRARVVNADSGWVDYEIQNPLAIARKTTAAA